jgi:2-amino-4-hydroxy-6-hydroxymethyldihydropteridine diphosphokinase
MTLAFVALGSNLGDRLATLAAAVSALSESAGLEIRRVSHAYESEPWGVADQPPFANAVVAVEFAGDAEELLSVCKAVERRLGRAPAERYGPRAIDLDVLLFGHERRTGPDLTIPHARMLERDFVVKPLLEVAPGIATPDGAPVDPSRAHAGRVTGVLGTLPGFETLTPGG